MPKEPKLVTNLKPGDRYAVIKVVKTIFISADEAIVTWDDDTVTSYQLSGKPALEIEK